MFIMKIERFLWPWEKKRFDKLFEFVNSSPRRYVHEIKPDVSKILDNKYVIGEGGTHIWIHRKGNYKRLVIIYHKDDE